MLEAILQAASSSPYDFTRTAFPDDPLKERFPEWLAYYKTKWAIAKVLQPKSILEVGVRFGYSAAAFLAACPTAHYVGIDADCAEFGGFPGAIEWAKKITAGLSTEFIVADSQKMARFPGEIYDLIHVDGQQDGDGTFHDMELACKQARFVLADGFFWTRQNFFALSEFLFQQRELLEYYSVIPGYAGDLLLKIASTRAEESALRSQQDDSLTLRGAYTSAYYLNDCGGFQQYRNSGGKRLQDLRLIAVGALAGLQKKGRALDLGCGRGELTYYLARQGFQVTGIDYSADAIALAEGCFAGEAALRQQVQLICGDVNSATLDGLYHLVIASDLIEHLSPSELDRLYSRISTLLTKDGVLVVHTFPNRWYYQYEYGRRRRIAQSVGAYLPPEPRSAYERMMHVNEQSPRILQKQLRKYFPNVLLWFGAPERPAGSLARSFSRHEMRASPDLFAVASQSPIPGRQVLSRLQSGPLDEHTRENLRMSVQYYPATVEPEEVFEVGIRIANRSSVCLTGFPPYPVRLSYRWLSRDGRSAIESEALRSALWPPLEACSTGTYQVKVRAPWKTGPYRLRLTLVQELVNWFDEVTQPVAADVELIVTKSQSPNGRLRSTATLSGVRR